MLYMCVRWAEMEFRAVCPLGKYVKIWRYFSRGYTSHTQTFPVSLRMVEKDAPSLFSLKIQYGLIYNAISLSYSLDYRKF